MDIRDRRGLRDRAGQALAANSGNPRLTAAVYVLIVSLSALVVSILSTVLRDRISQTGGLADLGLRSILSTIRTVLPLAQALVYICLELGYQKASLDVIRRRAVSPRTLTSGFRRFGPLLRAVLLQGGLYFLLAMGAGYIASYLFLLTPLSAGFFSLIQPMLTDPQALYDALYTDLEFQNQAFGAMLPVIPIALAVFALLAAPFFYRYRMTNYCLLEEPRRGALAAMTESSRMMKGSRVALLKLDVGFWWFYLGQLLVTAILYGDMILPALGVTLPWSETVSYYVFYVASLLLQGVLYYLFLNRVQTTYAAAYEALRPQPRQSTGGVVLGNIFDLAKDYREDDL